MSVLTQMFKRGQRRGDVKFVPKTPTQEVINTPRLPYENQELNLINNRCKKNIIRQEIYLSLSQKII